MRVGAGVVVVFVMLSAWMERFGATLARDDLSILDRQHLKYGARPKCALTVTPSSVAIAIFVCIILSLLCDVALVRVLLPA